MELSMLRFINEGYSADDAEIEAILDEGAFVDSIRIRISTDAKDAKNHMKAAHVAVKRGDKKIAKRELEQAITGYKKLRADAQEIDDDNIFVNALRAGLTASAITALGIIAGPIGLEISSIVGFVVGMIPTIEYDTAVGAKKVKINKAGVHGTEDVTQWWKAGVSRANAVMAFDRYITACEKIKEKL